MGKSGCLRFVGQTFGGSGYDVACATADSPIFYHRLSGQAHIQAVDFEPPFVEHLYFVYL